jgi:hypothetical protein
MRIRVAITRHMDVFLNPVKGPSATPTPETTMEAHRSSSESNTVGFQHAGSTAVVCPTVWVVVVGTSLVSASVV